MKDFNKDFAEFLVQRESVSDDYINGRSGPLAKLSTHCEPATFFPPSGARVRGAANVNAANESGAQIFGIGSTGRFENFQSGSSGDLGFWTGIQYASVMMKGKDAPVEMELRTTEIFRREDGHWKLIYLLAPIC